MPPHHLTNCEMQRYYQNEPLFNRVTDVLKLSFARDSKKFSIYRANKSPLK